MTYHRSAHVSRFWLVVLAGSLILTVTALQSFQESPRAKGVSVTYSHGVVHASIPSPQDRHTGTLLVEVLDPAGAVLGRTERRVQSGSGAPAWEADIALAKPLPLEDLAWQRLRYRFTYDGVRSAPSIEDVESISQVLRMPVMHILGQQSYFAGGQAAVRVVVTDSDGAPVASGSLKIELLTIELNDKPLFSGALNPRGTTQAQFQLPAGLTGTFPLHYAVDTPLGGGEYTQQIRVEDKASILLTTEKPLYQPGQTIHVRALALDRLNHQATANHALTFEMEDPRGNKVFKSATHTDAFGVASAEFPLADEVNLGAYHLRASMDGNTQELTLDVERYVLPKFKVAIEFAGDNGFAGDKDRHGYRPGQHVTGTVRANYFFGKPVDHAEVSVQASGMDVAKFQAGSAKGQTDGEGVYRFDFALPSYFAGRPLSQGAARVLVEATVKDSAQHSETRGEPIVVSESPLIVTAVPEGGTLIPHLENQLYVLTSYADGKAALSTVRVHADGMPDQTATTGEGGVATVLLPAGAREKLQIDASDRDGNKSTSTVTLETRSGQDQVLLRADRAIYKTGDRIALRVLSTKRRGSVYVDVIKEGQSILTRDIDIENGQGELSLTATPELAGTVELNAYQFGGDARPVADRRVIFVQPADELKIETSTDRDSYKPGEDARVRFHVTNASGQGVEAALGLQVVDEAVFALAEKQPGFAEVFFYLEQEAMKPRYEIHSFGVEQVLAPRPPGRAEEAQRDRAAQALFAATDLVRTNHFETEVGRTAPQTKYAVYAAQYRTQFNSQLDKLAEAADRSFAKRASHEDLAVIVATLDAPSRRDAWGTDFRVEPFPPANAYLVRSAGPDKRFNTADDQVGFVQVRTATVVNAPGQGKAELVLEHDRGPFNGLAAVTGCVVDPAGSIMAGVKVEVKNIATGAVHSAVTDGSCNFDLSGLAPGSYQIAVSSRGIGIWTGTVTLQARDRAVASISLTAGSTAKTVVVVPAPAQAFAFGGLVGGVDAGIIGGLGNGGGFGGGGGAGAGGGRGGRGPVRQFNAATLAAPMPAPNQVAMIAVDALKSVEPAAHVRSYFPEALYINPEIITDKDGRASIEIPLADSITTWRMAMLASTVKGALGSATSSIKVFQDFFVDLDLPVTLTQGDRISLPVAVYNYSGSSGAARLELHPQDWFSLVSDTATKTVPVESGRVGAAQFTIEAKRIGKFKLTLSAGMNGGADIVVREIEVVPNGREQTQVFNGRVDSTVEHEVHFPPTAIPDASKLFVRLYPGPLSQVIEGMDAILRMPNGCFEQTSSATYPNVLALDYMKTTRKLTPEVHAKAEGFIVTGYQRLLTFEVPGGGFSWFGQAPANKILTAYGLMEFSDMSKVHDVDPKLIQRTQQWLAAQQQPDGSWKPDTNFINEGATNRFTSDVLRISAYIAWSLENTGYQGPAVERARQFISQNLDAARDAYTLAVLANFAVDYGKDRPFAEQAIARLLDARTEKDDQVWWDAAQTGVLSTGSSAAIETTGLAVQALLKSGENSAVATRALTFLASKKNAQGWWGTTQATIMALRALLLSSSKGSSDVRGNVEISLNGKVVETLALTPANNDLLQQFVFKNADLAAANRVGIKFVGTGSLAYQVAGSYFTPWQNGPAAEPLSIDVQYDRTTLPEDDIATATATVRNNQGKSANMVMVDLGIPPGFDLLTEDLQSFQEKTAGRSGGRLEKFSLTATQAILYFDSIPAGRTVTLNFRLRARYPVRARTFASRVYEYYDPDVQAVAQPAELEIRKR